MTTNTRRLRANLMLLLTAMIWGAAFVAQDVAMDSMPPFTFNAVRLFVAALALALLIGLLNGRKHQRADAQAIEKKPMTRAEQKTLLVGGVCCGVALFLGTSFQQLGIKETSAGKAGFVTALYIVLVPLTGLFTGRSVRRNVWLAVLLCLGGLFLLCVTEALTVSIGDVYLLLCALSFTGHILVIDHFSPRTDCVRMSCIQFLTASALCALVMALTERPTWEAIGNGIVPILYAGVLSGGVGYTLQMLAQRDTDPTVASLLMSLESVFAVLAGWIILGDALSPRELCGCALMMAGILLAQLPGRRSANRTLPSPAAAEAGTGRAGKRPSNGRAA